jgi:hypothetical protein
MEIKIKPVPGCLNIILAVLTLGVYPLAAWLTARNWPKSVDEQGLVTRGGKRLPWNEFTKITKVITNINQSAAKTEHYELFHPGGKVIVAEYRLENGAQIMDYIWNRLPEQARKAQ